ncbi:MAG: galactokinase [Blautia sp.]|nr:galactokinase [Blautia sp.]
MAKNAEELLQGFLEGQYDDLLLDIYADESVLDHQRDRYVHALRSFTEIFGDTEVEIYSAPGRSEVGGNHTDHQHGQVLAASVNLDVIAVAAPTDDELMQVKSEGYEQIAVSTHALDVDDLDYGTSKALIRGTAAAFKDRGYKIGGFHAFMTSEVLGGSGLSSSAAFEVAVGNILSGLYNDGEVDAVTIAIAAQYAENKYFGKPCGLMDQMASSVGSLVNIDFNDPEDPVIRKVNADFQSFGHSLCIVDTKGSHADLTDDYAAIPVEMKSVAACFGKEYLRKVDEDEFLQKLPEIREKCGDRATLRALHYFEDHKRVGLQVEALEEGNFDEFKRLITESGNSSFKYLQNVYSNKDVHTQNVSVALALSELILKGRGAVRVHGGGFAGTIQAFVPNDVVAEYKKGMEACFGEGACYVLKVRKYGGMRVL